MPCHSAIVKKIVTASPDDAVEVVLKSIKKGKVQACAIIDESGAFLGVFSMKILLKNLLPVSVAMTNGVQIDIKVTAAPGVAKRLANVKTLSVSELMERKPDTVFPDAPIWEGVSVLTKNGSPLAVVDSNGKFQGFITYDSLVDDLESIQSTDS
ncbi:MAG: hypothetical protein COB14_02775 [Alphaproteobacteria bacterium]|nr:MAG: hypothetical protein COB14_02775 [Alphaproteobacteria bacterium]